MRSPLLRPPAWLGVGAAWGPEMLVLLCDVFYVKGGGLCIPHRL